MQKFTADDPETKSADVVANNLDALKSLIPDAFTEGKVDFEVLKQLLGGAVEERDEKYGLTWHGKRAARQLALTPSTGTLRPCPEESVDWDTTQNLMIEGDNLEVLKLLQKSYTGKVKLIYIDPPYNTGNDFVYPDDYRDGIGNYLELTKQVDQSGAGFASNPETSGRFHTKWLNMISPRIRLARTLMADEGALFMSTDDTELGNALSILKEIFGSENLIGTFIWEKRRSRENRKTISVNHDYITCVAKNRSAFEAVRGLLPLTDEARARYSNPDSDPRGDWQSVALTAQAGHGTPSQFYTITTPSGREVDPPSGNCWRVTRARLDELIADGRIWFGLGGSNVPRQKVFLSEGGQGLTPHTLWTADEVGTTDTAKRSLNSLFGGESVFGTPKPVDLLRRIVEIGCAKDGIVLDFFAGSGSTAEAVVRENMSDGGSRQYILVQLPEQLSLDEIDQKAGAQLCDRLGRPRTISELTKERLRRVGRDSEVEASAAESVGFRVFKLDSSNIEAWEPDREDLVGSLTEAIEHLKGDRTEQDILFELLLKLGLELTVPIESRVVAGKTVYSVGAGTLLVCLAESMSQDDIEAVGLGIVAWHEDLDSAGECTVVFRDSAFADDVAKTNLSAILEQHGLSTVRSL